jgi:nicotinamide-nucleotide amidase
MNAAIVAVGTELLRHGKVDTNGQWITDRLLVRGVRVDLRAAVGDDAHAIGALVAHALGMCDLVLLTGGLGPTADDRTREGVAEATGHTLERDEEVVRALAARFAVRGFPFLPMQARQADRPAGAVWLANPIGSAPGFALAHGGGLVVVLPGVPAEMRAMFDEHVVPRLAPSGIARRALHVAGKSEAAVETALADLYGEEGVEVTILAGRDGVDLHLLAQAASHGEALERVGRVEQRMIERLGSDLYGTGEETLARAVGTGLVALGRTVAVAESCTAGLLAAALTSVPGSSAWFRGGFLPYADDLKVGLCGVDPALLAAHGAVSEPVVRALARGARDRARADLGVGISGIAGPGGGTQDKPVGLVHVALADRSREEAWATRWVGDRELVRARAVSFALDRIRRFYPR